MIFKTGVKLIGLRPEALAGMIVCKAAFCGISDAPFVITSVNDSVHGRGSLHFAGQAFDIRTRDTEQYKQQLIVDEMRNSLTDEFDVVLKSDHIHVEYQPKA